MAQEPCSTATSRDLEKLEEKIDLQLKAARNEQDLYNRLTDKALEMATSDLGRRLTEMNNFRDQIVEERQVFIRKETYEQLAERLARVAETTENRIRVAEDALAEISGNKWAFGVGLTLLTLAISAGGLFLRHP